MNRQEIATRILKCDESEIANKLNMTEDEYNSLSDEQFIQEMYLNNNEYIAS